MARLIGAKPENAVFVANATTGISTALRSVPLAERAEILVTDHVYGAILIAARRAVQQVGGQVKIVPIDLVDDVDAHVAAFEAATNERTRLAIVDHVASPTGLVLPVVEDRRRDYANGTS